MKLYKLHGLALSAALIATVGCGGSKPAEETTPEPAEAAQEEAAAVFEEDFEAGEATEWTESASAAGEEESASEPDKE